MLIANSDKRPSVAVMIDCQKAQDSSYRSTWGRGTSSITTSRSSRWMAADLTTTSWKENQMATNDDSGASFYARYIDDPKTPVEPEKVLRGPLLKPIATAATPRSSPTEKLLDFCINHWPEPIISVRAICWRGPNCI